MSTPGAFAKNTVRRAERWVRRVPLVAPALRAAIVERRTRSVPLRERLRILESLPPAQKRPSLTARDALAVVHRCIPGTGAGRCLPRSLTLYGLLVAMGDDDLVFCLGVHPDVRASAGSAREFIAHAWVETRGSPLGEDAEVRSTYRLLVEHSRIAPAASASLCHE